MSALQIEGLTSAMGGSNGSLVLGIILVAVGLVVAFFGEELWSAALAIIGGLIGGIIGYAIGSAIFDNWLVCAAIAVFCAIVGGILFAWMVKVAVAVLIGAVIAGMSWVLTGEIIVALVVFLIAAILAYYFMEKIIEFLTAFAGGAVAGGGVYILLYNSWPGWSPWVALCAGGAIFVIGAIYQLAVKE